MTRRDDSDISKMNANEDIQRQRTEWRKKAWSIPELKGGKNNWFPLVKELMQLVKDGEANDMDAEPNLSFELPEKLTWRSYTPFLNGVGLTRNQNGKLCLSDYGIKFSENPAKLCLANLLQNKVRLFGEVVEYLASTSATIKELNDHFIKEYNLNWKNLSNIRRRMNWLEVLGLIQEIGERKWETTDMGRKALQNWILVKPFVLNVNDEDTNDIEIDSPPEEIEALLQQLIDSPELLSKRSTYNIWAPSPNRIGNLRTIIQYASERVEKGDFFKFIEEEFTLKLSSVESMMPFLKASGLLKEVGRNVYMATPVAEAWLETGSDLDFIRILHANMRFVGEMIVAAEEDIVRNDLYAVAKKYGLNAEKARWIAGFLVEVGLLEETQYLHLKATPVGLAFASTLPLEAIPDEKNEDSNLIADDNSKDNKDPSMFEQLNERLQIASTCPMAEGKASGVAFEEDIATIFKYMGFNTTRIGGSGDTDVVVHWHDNEGKLLTAIIDAKSKSNGLVSHNDISDVAIETHKEKNNAAYVAIVGPGFSGDTIRNHAKKKGFALITTDDLIEIASASRAVGLSIQEVSMIFRVPDGLSELEELISTKQRELDIISIVVSKFIKEQDALESLSPRDLFMLLRDSEMSPSQEELMGVFDILSGSEVGILHKVDKNQSIENIKYQLDDTHRAVNRLRALAGAIEEGLDEYQGQYFEIFFL